MRNDSIHYIKFEKISLKSKNGVLATGTYSLSVSLRVKDSPDTLVILMSI